MIDRQHRRLLIKQTTIGRFEQGALIERPLLTVNPVTLAPAYTTISPPLDTVVLADAAGERDAVGGLCRCEFVLKQAGAIER
jgi:hypothetical protein